MKMQNLLIGVVVLAVAYYFLVYKKTEPIPTPEPTQTPGPTPNPLAPDAWYRFINNVQDSSGHGYNGVPDGNPIYKNIPVGNSRVIQLDGANDYFKVTTNKIANGNYLTVAFYVNPSNQAAGQNSYSNDIIRSQCTGGGHWGVTTHGDFNKNGQIQIQTGWLFGTGREWINPGIAIPKNAWTHIALTYDRPNEILKVYVRKALVRRYEGTVGTKTYNTGFAVGMDCAGAFKGMLADVRLWNRVLTDSEIRRLS